jgi:hypothetical protein
VQLGLENKKKTTWAVVLAVVALLAVAYEFIPFFTGASEPASSAQAAAPVPTHEKPRTPKRAGKKARVENLDPTLRLDLLATSEETQYEGHGRNIFVSQAEDVVIPHPVAPAAPDAPSVGGGYHPPTLAQAPPIPLKFYGFASRTGEPKKIFLKLGDDVFVAGEGEIVDRRYKVIRISPNSVEIQDVLNSGPPQNIPLTQG